MSIALVGPLGAEPVSSVVFPPPGPRADRPARRTFAWDYKVAIVNEYDGAVDRDKGEILRRERLYTSHITQWRAAISNSRSAGTGKRGRPRLSAEEKRIQNLEAENARLLSVIGAKERELAAANEALDVLGKGVAFLESLSSRNAR